MPIFSPCRKTLPYHPDLGHILRLATPPEARGVWLRHGLQSETFAAFPVEWVLSSQPLLSPIQAADAKTFAQATTEKITKQSSAADIQQLLEKYPLPCTSDIADLPFRGGVIGFSAYDAMPLGNPTFPAQYFGFYPHFIYINHAHKKAEAICLPLDSDTPSFTDATQPLITSSPPFNDTAQPFTGKTHTTTAQHFANARLAWGKWLSGISSNDESDILPPGKTNDFQLESHFSALTSPEKYRSDFQKIQQYLLQGDCYQVNYAQAFHTICKGHSAFAMQRLLAVSNPRYAAWLSLPEGDVMSLSPELFLRVENRQILASPIKGTAPRLADPVADAEQARALQNSEKNRSENLMIVDLLRNDISQHAITGSVTAENCFVIESLPQVHHLVSHITATLCDDASTLDLLRDCFPGGSITGAPKKRAMEIIAELESTPRSIYCGSIGYINSDGNAGFNIAIRTLLRLGNNLYAWAGGGIVADSDCDAEYQECFDKIGALMKALEDM
jgi:para-aminobenzoate synthetase component 1